jgi:hypothetical protein
VQAAIAGLDVFISLVGFPGSSDPVKLFQPLNDTPRFESYVTPNIGIPPWMTEVEPADERIAGFVGGFRDVIRILHPCPTCKMVKLDKGSLS